MWHGGYGIRVSIGQRGKGSPSARRRRMIYPYLSADGYAGLKAEAQRRGLHPDVLAANLLDTIARDGLYEAVDPEVAATAE